MRELLRLGLQHARGHPWHTLGVLLAGLVQAGARAATLWAVQSFLQRVTTAGPHARRYLALAAGTIMLGWLLRSVADFLGQVARQRLLQAASLSTVTGLAGHLLRVPVRVVESSGRGDLTQAISADVAAVQTAIALLSQMVVSLLLLLAVTGIAFMVSPYLAAIGLVLLPAAAAPVVLLGRRALEAARRMRQAGCSLVDQLLQLHAGARVIRAYQGEDRELHRFGELATRFYRDNVRLNLSQAAASVAYETLAGLGLMLVVLAGGLRILDGRLEWPALLTFLMVLVQLHEPARQIVQGYGQLRSSTIGAARLQELMAAPADRGPLSGAREAEHRERSSNRGARAIDAGNVTACPGIRLDRVCLAYGRFMALRNIDLELPAGELVGLVGPSGSGKSSLLALIAGFVQPTSGRLLIGGVDAGDLSLQERMARIALVPQEPFLLADTIRENIRYGRPAARAGEVEAAARAAGIHDEIAALPDGYETRVGLGGRPLSGGQAQRLNIARAMLKPASLLLLDEPTSALDLATERSVHAVLERLRPGRTLLIASHRLAALRHADQIVVLADGAVEAVGSHAHLLACSPRYRSMWQAQAGDRHDSPPHDRHDAAAEMSREPIIARPDAPEPLLSSSPSNRR